VLFLLSFVCYCVLAIPRPASNANSKTISMDSEHACSVDLSGASADVITALLGRMSLNQRLTCALVSRDWAKAAAATATKSIVKHGVQDLTQLQQWLDTHGGQVETLQLLECPSTLHRLPCAQLQDLVLHGDHRVWVRRARRPYPAGGPYLRLSSTMWSDIAAATKLTSLSLNTASTPAKQADVVSALAALPDLQQLTWRDIRFVEEDARRLSDSRLLQRLTRLTGLDLCVVAAKALQHLSSLTKLQHFSVISNDSWDTAGYPGLQELQALTSLGMENNLAYRLYARFPSCVSHLTALQQLEVLSATIPELNGLTALTTLTKLVVTKLSACSTPLQLPALQHLSLTADTDWSGDLLRMSCLATCTQLRCLSLNSFHVTGPGSLVASSMLQELDLVECRLGRDKRYFADMSSWKMLLPGPGRLPHLSSLALPAWGTGQEGVGRLVECCSALRVLQLDDVTDEQCSTLAQLTGLQDLHVSDPEDMSAAGLRHLARLEQLTRLKFERELDPCKVSTILQEQLSDQVQGCRHALVNKVGAGCLVTECCAVVFQAVVCGHQPHRIRLLGVYGSCHHGWLCS